MFKGPQDMSLAGNAAADCAAAISAAVDIVTSWSNFISKIKLAQARRRGRCLSALRECRSSTL